jgi:hypothetical protein
MCLQVEVGGVAKVMQANTTTLWRFGHGFGSDDEADHRRPHSLKSEDVLGSG